MTSTSTSSAADDNVLNICRLLMILEYLAFERSDYVRRWCDVRRRFSIKLAAETHTCQSLLVLSTTQDTKIRENKAGVPGMYVITIRCKKARQPIQSRIACRQTCHVRHCDWLFCSTCVWLITDCLACFLTLYAPHRLVVVLNTQPSPLLLLSLVSKAQFCIARFW